APGRGRRRAAVLGAAGGAAAGRPWWSLSCAATANAIVLAGARPVLVDCESNTLNIDAAAVERALTKKTKAIMPVHFAGQPCAMDEILEIARRRSLLVIEDAAHALGAEYKGRKIGTIGDATVYSFHPIKSITTGEGGLVVLRDDDWADRMRLVRFHGIRTSAWERQAGGKSPLYAIEAPGLKYTMMDIQAAIGIHQLAKLDGFIARRTRLARRYRESFQDVEGVRLLGSVPYAYKHAWHL